MHIGNWRITTHSEFFTNNIHDQIAQRQNCEMEKRELERQRKAMEIQETQRKWAEAMAQPVEKAQRQECGDIFSIERVMDRMKKRMEEGEGFAYSIPVNLLHQETQQLRAKALELACHLYNTPYYNQSQRDIVGVAQLFYTYITKG